MREVATRLVVSHCPSKLWWSSRPRVPVFARRALQALITLGMQAGVDYNYVPLSIDCLPLLSGIRPRSSVWKCFSIWMMMMEMRILSKLPDGRFKRSFISFCVIPGSSLIRRFTLAMFGSIASFEATVNCRSRCRLVPKAV